MSFYFYNLVKFWTIHSRRYTSELYKGPKKLKGKNNGPVERNQSIPNNFCHQGYPQFVPTCVRHGWMGIGRNGRIMKV